MTIARKLASATAITALAASGVAAAAQAPFVSAQKTSTAKTAPLTIPGTGIKKGQRLPNGARIVYRDVTLVGKQTVRLFIKAPAGKRIRGLAQPEGSNVGFVVTDSGNYVGATKVRVRAFTNPNDAGELTGRIYGLAR